MRKLASAVLFLVAATAAAPSAEIGDPARGLAYARTDCSECHGVEPSDTLSPFSDLPTFREIANIPGMSELALISFFQTPHPTMPDFVVEGGAIRDLIAYFGTLRR
ncbi:MAG: cytochrome C [Bauldia sp.]|nr:cytochrome C [Bauldia sp.]